MKKIILYFACFLAIQNLSLSQTVRRNFADVNGDNYQDKIEYKDYGQNIIDIIVSFGSSSGTYGEPFTFSSHIDRGYPDKPWGFIDVNNDGKADFITIRGIPPDRLEQVTYFSNGNGLDTEHRTFTHYVDGGLTLLVYPTIKVTGLLEPEHDPDRNFQRGMPSYIYGGNSPESWVRGKATLDQASGILSITIQLETDATDAGPKGRVTVALTDCSGKAIANLTTDEVETGGKNPGSAKIVNFSSQKQIDPEKACKVCSLYVTAQKTGVKKALWDGNGDKLKDAFNIVVAYFSGQ
ncbi:hypothetical protein A3860_18640 [Niastella vici]|uniref:VCBS repeat-containing protein n=1 Tax=Niastella vici TaxID=1703345 RepID=A0A1V9G2H2_9BACT|nr:hypothetical protein [Niastella vici]OQP64777.1 hypothetical protein A3860_18640 [Niastella vici]